MPGGRPARRPRGHRAFDRPGQCHSYGALPACGWTSRGSARPRACARQTGKRIWHLKTSENGALARRRSQWRSRCAQRDDDYWGSIFDTPEKRVGRHTERDQLTLAPAPPPESLCRVRPHALRSSSDKASYRFLAARPATRDCHRASERGRFGRGGSTRRQRFLDLVPIAPAPSLRLTG